MTHSLYRSQESVPGEAICLGFPPLQGATEDTQISLTWRSCRNYCVTRRSG